MRKLIVFVGSFAILTACSQQSNNNSSSQEELEVEHITKSYKTEKQLEHGKETRI